MIRALAREAEGKGTVTSLMEVKPFVKCDSSAETFAHAVAAATAEAQRKWELAFSEAESFVRVRADSPGAHVALARAASELGKHEVAREHYQRAVELEPRNAVLWIGLYNPLMEQKKYREAAAARKAVGLLPREAMMWMGLGQALDRAEDLDEAEKAFGKALGTRPSDPVVCFALGKFLANHRPERLNEAPTLIDNAIALNTDGKIPAEVLDEMRQDLEKHIASKAEESARMRAEVLIARIYAAKRDGHEAGRRLIRILARAE